MATIILYSDDPSKTVEDIKDKTDPSLIDEIVVIDDQDLAVAVDEVISGSGSSDFILLIGKVKVKEGWINGLLDVKTFTLASPVMHSLDVDHWSTQDSCMHGYGYRWDFSIYGRQKTADVMESPACCPVCVAFSRDTYDWIGGLDPMLLDDEQGHLLELSIRAWMKGGSVIVESSSKIAAPNLPIPAQHNNFARIAEKWFSEYSERFYDRHGSKSSDFNIGKIPSFSRNLSAFEYLSKFMPELLSAYSLRNKHYNKEFAVVAPGPSLDHFNLAEIYKSGVVIGADYVGMVIDCDYVTTFDLQTAVALRKKYADYQFILPLALHDRSTASLVDSASFAPEAVICELARENDSVSSVHPPFINYADPSLFALHVGMFAGASSIKLYGFDNKFIGESSHTSRIPNYYDSGDVWKDSEAVQREFSRREHGLEVLRRVSLDVSVPVARINYI